MHIMLAAVHSVCHVTLDRQSAHAAMHSVRLVMVTKTVAAMLDRYQVQQSFRLSGYHFT